MVRLHFYSSAVLPGFICPRIAMYHFAKQGIDIRPTKTSINRMISSRRFTPPDVAGALVPPQSRKVPGGND